MKPSREFHAVVDGLRALPAKPRSLTGPRNWLNGILLFSDYLASVPPRMSKLTAPIRKYPKDFEKVRFESKDGTKLVGWFGRSPHPGPRPALILLPGLFTSKDNNRIRARSLKIRREWGFHILTLDLRGIGESERNYSTPGLKEAEDIDAAIAWLRGYADTQPIHLYAESLAASAALVAVGRAGREGRGLVDGRVLSVSPYADPLPIMERFSGPIDWSNREFAGVKAFFKFVLRLSGSAETEFTHYVAAGAARYGLDLEELIKGSTALLELPHAKCETLVVHSEDDLLVPVAQARNLQAAVAANPNVRVEILPWGNHCLYEMAEPDWYWAMLAGYFGADPVSSSQRLPPAVPAAAATVHPPS